MLDSLILKSADFRKAIEGVVRDVLKTESVNFLRTYKAKVVLPPFKLGQKDVVSVLLNGESTTLVIPYSSDLSSVLQKGTMVIVAVVANSYRNAFVWKRCDLVSGQQSGGTSDFAAYNVVCSVQNGYYMGNNLILPDGTARIMLFPDTGYNLPSDVSVTGADYEYDALTGVIELSGATADVTIEAICSAATEQFETPTITLSGDTLSTAEVEGVTEYRVYDGDTYIGYIDEDNVFHTV